MKTTEFIEAAVSRGEQLGLHALSGREQVVYAIAEAEAYCDIDGIDSLIHKYGRESMGLFAQAFLEIGASEIAAVLQTIASTSGTPNENTLSNANRLITERSGYSYEEVESFVARGA